MAVRTFNGIDPPHRGVYRPIWVFGPPLGGVSERVQLGQNRPKRTIFVGKMTPK